MLEGIHPMGFTGDASSKEPSCECRRHKRCGFDPWVGKIPWRRAQQPILVFLPGESHGQKSLAGCSPQRHRVRHDWMNYHTCIHPMSGFFTFIISLASELLCKSNLVKENTTKTYWNVNYIKLGDGYMWGYYTVLTAHEWV